MGGLGGEGEVEIAMMSSGVLSKRDCNGLCHSGEEVWRGFGS